MSDRIVDLAVAESDPYAFYAASATGGIFKTTNKGRYQKCKEKNSKFHAAPNGPSGMSRLWKISKA